MLDKSHTVLILYLVRLFTWNISECLSDALILVVDDERTTLHDTSSITHLTLTSSESLRGIDLLI